MDLCGVIEVKIELIATKFIFPFFFLDNFKVFKCTVLNSFNLHIYCMVELKTKENDADVRYFIESISEKEKKADSMVLIGMLKEISGFEPKMWGDSIIGFGRLHYRYKTGREGDWFRIGFSPRKQALTIYLMDYCSDRNEELRNQLGKHRMGKSCLYIKHLSDIKIDVLYKIIEKSLEKIEENYPYS